MMVYNLQWIIRLRGSKDPHAFLLDNGFTEQRAQALLNNETDEVDMDETGRLMDVLDCNMNDLLEWQGDPESHLAQLKKPSMQELERMLQSFTPDEVLDIVRRRGL